ncbi:MAG TPA: transcriptional regulator [Myxococcales bacterium]|jgi:HTH-type transcriptional regulator/antitoxin HigA|nr:transcriptional regulator [Myxococcales bacterium]
MKKPRLKVINADLEYRRALASIEELWDAKPGTEEHDALEVLALLVEDYERRTFPMEEPDPVEAIRFRLEQAGKEPRDLVPILGSRSRVSEVMNHKRSLSLQMIRRLHDALQIPFEALIPADSNPGNSW